MYDAVNTPSAVRARDGRYAPVIVMPYPLVLPVQGRAACLGFSANEVRFAERLQRALNRQVQSSVQRASADGRHIYYATPVESAFQPNRTACDKGGHVNDVNLVTGALASVDDNRLQEFMHPNKAGYSAETLAVFAWSSGLDPDLRQGKPSNGFPATTRSSVIDLRGSGKGVSLMRDGQEVPITAGENGWLNLDELPAGTQVTIVMYSAPRVLGVGRVAEDGSLDQRVTIPADAAPGRHLIRVEYATSEGVVVAAEQPIRVRQSLPPWVLILGGLGLVGGLAALGCWGALIRGRRRAAT